MAQKPIETVATLPLRGPIVCDDDPKEQGVSDVVFVDALKNVGAVDLLRIEIDSQGGKVMVMDRLIDALEKHSAKRIETHCLGQAYSAAGLVFLAGVVRTMSPDAKFMMHNAYVPTLLAAVDAKSLRLTNDRIAKYIAKRTGIRLEKVIRMMDEETYLDAHECLAYGIATRIGGPPAPKTSVADLPVRECLRREYEDMRRERELRQDLRFRMRMATIDEAIERANSRRVPKPTKPANRGHMIPLPAIPERLRGKVAFSSADWEKLRMPLVGK